MPPHVGTLGFELSLTTDGRYSICGIQGLRNNLEI